MANASSAVDEAAELLKNRIAELEDELGKLQRALSNLTGDGRSGRRGPGRPRTRGTATTQSSPRRRRRRRSGTRAEQAVKLVDETPGITASQIAERMSIKPNYLYRVLSELQADGKIRKDGRSYHPAGGGGGASEAKSEPEPAASS